MKGQKRRKGFINQRGNEIKWKEEMKKGKGEEWKEGRKKGRGEEEKRKVFHGTSKLCLFSLNAAEWVYDPA